MRKVIALDPGGTTGVAFWNERNDAFQFAQWDTPVKPMTTSRCCWFGDTLRYHVAESLGSGDPQDLTVVLVENFEFRREDRKRDKIDYTPSELLGIVKYVTAKHFGEEPRFKLYIQSASTAKGFWDNDKLTRVGLYHPLKRHAMDALRHLLYYRTFQLNDKAFLEKLK